MTYRQTDIDINRNIDKDRYGYRHIYPYPISIKKSAQYKEHKGYIKVNFNEN